MKLELYGGPKSGGWNAHSADYEPDLDVPISSCPFNGCATATPMLESHLPVYVVQCDGCGAHGPRIDLGSRWSPRTSRAKVEILHRMAFEMAIAAWNTRTAPASKVTKPTKKRSPR